MAMHVSTRLYPVYRGTDCEVKRLKASVVLYLGALIPALLRVREQVLLCG